MGLAFRQIHPVFVGEVSGVDITRRSRATRWRHRAGMDRYRRVVFRDQKLTDEQQMAFSRTSAPGGRPRGQHHQARGQRLPSAMNDVSNLARTPAARARVARAPVQLGNMLCIPTALPRESPPSIRCSRRAW